MTNNPAGRRFYVGMGFVLILFSVLGFAPFVAVRFDGSAHTSPALMVHGISFLGWLSLYTYQASLVRARNLKTHMKLGKASIGLALVMLISGLVITTEVFGRGESSATPFTPEQFIILPMLDITLFVAYYTLAMLNRRVPDTHKRLMLLVGIMMMDPAVGRFGLTLGFPPIGILLHFSLLVAMCVYDRRTLGRIHKVSWIALPVLAARYAAVFIIGPTEAWASFTHMLMG